MSASSVQDIKQKSDETTVWYMKTLEQVEEDAKRGIQDPRLLPSWEMEIPHTVWQYRYFKCKTCNKNIPLGREVNWPESPPEASVLKRTARDYYQFSFSDMYEVELDSWDKGCCWLCKQQVLSLTQ